MRRRPLAHALAKGSVPSVSAIRSSLVTANRSWASAVDLPDIGQIALDEMRGKDHVKVAKGATHSAIELGLLAGIRIQAGQAVGQYLERGLALGHGCHFLSSRRHPVVVARVPDTIATSRRYPSGNLVARYVQPEQSDRRARFT